MADIMEMLATSPNETEMLVQMALSQQGLDPFINLDEDSKLDIAAQQLMSMLVNNRAMVQSSFPEIFAKFNEAEVYQNDAQRQTTLGAMPDSMQGAGNASLARPNLSTYMGGTGVTSGGGIAGQAPDPLWAKTQGMPLNERLSVYAQELERLYTDPANVDENGYPTGVNDFAIAGLENSYKRLKDMAEGGGGGITPYQSEALGIDRARLGLEQSKFGWDKDQDLWQRGFDTDKFAFEKDSELWQRDYLTASEKRRIVEQRAKLGLDAASTIGNTMNQSMQNTITASRSAIPAGMKYSPWGNPNTIGKYMQSVGLPFEATPAVGTSVNPGAVNNVVQDLINKAMQGV